ncbi:MAG TPA: hypothetical protein VEQ85_09855 [Lacipirellulaceae bacterium]|nr:hypothetical protein [Lacipirellulaceae bacterium]
MSSSAQVRSTAQIEALNYALARFADRVQNALESLDGELHRADQWIDHDRPAFWRAQIREAEDDLHQAKGDLDRCLLMTTADGQRPACREQKAAVEQAKARLDYCREKAEQVKHWQRSFRHEKFEYDGRIGQLRGLLAQQVPAARGALARILRRLEEYQIEQAPQTGLGHEPAGGPMSVSSQPAAASQQGAGGALAPGSAEVEAPTDGGPAPGDSQGE